MNAAIELKIYGGSRHLATLRKDVEVPAGLYSKNPISSAIGLTSSITANVDLQISNIAVDNNYNYLLVELNRSAVAFQTHTRLFFSH